MRISFEKNLIWISKPKSASSSYRNLLEKYVEDGSHCRGDFYQRYHMKLKELKKYCERKGIDFDAFTSIVPSRNPWELIVSLYFYQKTDLNGVRVWERKSLAYQPENLMSFTDWVRQPEWSERLRLAHSMKEYAFDNKGNRLATHILDVDSNATDILNVFNKNLGCNLSIRDIPRINSSPKDRDMYPEIHNVLLNPAVGKVIEDIFSYEIELFEYQMPNFELRA